MIILVIISQYYFFDNRLLLRRICKLIIKQTGLLLLLFHLVLDNDSSFSRIYGTQKVENNFQRYYRGPYAAITKRFLYPNARIANGLYDSKTRGFPTRFKYSIIIREEIVKEIYARYDITDGFVNSAPTLVDVIRTPQSNFGVQLGTQDIMFDCAGLDCDFNQWDFTSGFFYNSTTTLVDKDWAPQLDSYYDGFEFQPLAASGKNYSVYNETPTFKQGIRITGNDVLMRRIYSGLFPSGRNYFTPKPIAVGLYHGFTGYTFTGQLSYTKPIFDLENGQLERYYALNAFPIMRKGCTSYHFCDGFPCNPSVAEGLNYLYTKDLNGDIFYSISGEDPLYYELVGGRRGSEAADSEGGYHSKGIIGDSWLGFAYQILDIIVR
jgi:hypothetical protein